MRRRTLKRAPNATENAVSTPKYDVSGELETLKAEIASLRSRVDALERKRRNESVAGVSDELAQDRGAKRGPKPKHSPDISIQRDMFVRLFEKYWVEIEPLCGAWNEDGTAVARPPDMKKLRTFLVRLRDNPQGFQEAESAGELVERLTELETFLTQPSTRRYFSGNPNQERNRTGGDPRQLANALAGVPKIGIWRSLKICGAKEARCAVDMQETALPSYIRRKHPLLCRALEARQGMLLSSFLVSYPIKHDPHLRNLKADELQRIWDRDRI